MNTKNGYFTVEATMILPMAMLVIIIMIYLLLFQYDRCIMEQDAGALAVWGSVMQEEDEKRTEQQIKKKIAEIDKEIYIGWEETEQKAVLKHNQFTVVSQGGLSFPFGGGEDMGFWPAEVSYTFGRMDEVGFIRLCNYLAEEKLVR